MNVTPDNHHLDKIGNWSIDKLEILKAYSEKYAQILQQQKVNQNGERRLSFGYIDAFAGAGEHVHKDTGTVIPGSPLNALNLANKFDEYHFVDLDPRRVTRLQEICKGVKGTHVYPGDCNEVLLGKVFPQFRYQDYRRALCFLDPYGMHLKWEVLATAGAMKTIEVFLNFPVMDMNRNAKKKNLADVAPDDRTRMTAFWGDETWHQAMFAPSKQGNFLDLLAGDAHAVLELEKNDNEQFVAAFRKRLQDVAGFEFVPAPMAMRNSRNAVVYYLFFASNNSVGNRIASHILKKYRA